MDRTQALLCRQMDFITLLPMAIDFVAVEHDHGQVWCQECAPEGHSILEEC